MEWELFRYKQTRRRSVPVAALSKAGICGRSLAGIAVSNPADRRGRLFHVIECCQLAVSATDWSIVQRSPTKFGVSECELQGCWNKKRSLKRGTYDKERNRNFASSKKLGLSAKAWVLQLLPTVPLYKNYTLLNHEALCYQRHGGKYPAGRRSRSLLRPVGNCTRMFSTACREWKCNWADFFSSRM